MSTYLCSFILVARFEEYVALPDTEESIVDRGKIFKICVCSICWPKKGCRIPTVRGQTVVAMTRLRPTPPTI